MGPSRRSGRWRRARLPESGGRPERSPSERAVQIALRYLGRRERTVAEVRARLARAELESPAVEAAITELCEDGYLDDARYARVFVEDKRMLEGWGKERIERGLAQRGISLDLIHTALRGSDDETTERERALALLRRRFPQPRSEARERGRALGVLVRKGYDSETAYDVVRQWSTGG